ncbi:MAG: ArgE/DapE family deacylase [Gemmatimonadetes bacterium]|nr:ArgE/DapE family deacylase [Gemmatimonadota bacterium]
MNNDHSGQFETARTGDPVALARLLVSIPSVNPVLESQGAGESGVAKVCAELLEGWGLDVETAEVAPGRPNVVGRLEGSGGVTLLLNGHLDTVGIQGMSVPPFAAKTLGSRLVGRGACDMKGGVAALLAATYRLAQRGPRPNLLVVLTADEEHASLGMQAFVSSRPSADFAVVCEPTSLAVMPAHKGFVWVKGAFRGRAAHGSLPEEGVDAIRHAALFLGALDRYAAALRSRGRHPLLGYGSVHAGTIHGGSAPSVYPDHCEVQLECRTMPGHEADTVMAELEHVLAGVRTVERALGATLEVTLSRPGTEVSTESPLVQGLVASCEAHGLAAKVAGMTAWVDAAFLNQAGIPAVCFGPGSMAQAHTADEWIETSEIVKCADVLEGFARSLVGRG